MSEVEGIVIARSQPYRCIQRRCAIASILDYFSRFTATRNEDWDLRQWLRNCFPNCGQQPKYLLCPITTILKMRTLIEPVNFSGLGIATRINSEDEPHSSDIGIHLKCTIYGIVKRIPSLKKFWLAKKRVGLPFYGLWTNNNQIDGPRSQLQCEIKIAR